MTDFVVDGKPFETPEGAADLGYLQTPAPLEQVFSTGAMETTGAIGRYLRESLFDSDNFGAMVTRGLIAGGALAGGMPPEMQTVPSDLSALPGGPPVSAEEINSRSGAHITDKPLNQTLANLLIEAKQRELEREGVWARYANAHSWPTNLAVGTATFLADPLNLATLFVPGIGEEAITARLGTSLAARMFASGVATAAGATVAQAPLTALKYGIGREESSDYDLRQAFADLAMNAGAGAIFGAGFGGLGYLLHGRGLPEPPVSRETVPEAVTEASRILSADPTTNHAALGTAVSQIVEGRPVDVDSFFYRPPTPDTAIELAMREPGRAEIVTAPTVEAQARQLAPDVFAEFDPLRQSVQDLSDRIADPARIGREIDAERRAAMPSRAARRELIANRIEALRTELVNTELRMRDLAPAVTAATDQARAILDAGLANRAVAMGPAPPFPSLADIVSRERELRRTGFTAGMPQSEIDAGNAALEAHQQQPPPKPEAAPPTPPEGWAQPAAAAPAEPGEAPKPPGAAAAPAADPEIAEAEARLMASREGKPALLPEEQADLDTARAAVMKADQLEQSLQEAALCLKEAGM